MRNAYIQTVCGRISPAELGHCQVHEHIFVRPTPMAKSNPALCFCDYTLSLEELRAYKAAGGCAIGDAQPVFAGRSADALYQLSRESGVSIIASTGFHLDGFYNGEEFFRSEDKLFDHFCRELTEGMDGSAAKAGMVKAAIPREGAVGHYRTALTAAAGAAAQCGAALMLHTEAGENAENAVELCCRAGLESGRILLCHADRDAKNIARHKALAAMGVYMEYDTIGRFKYHGDDEEINLIGEMLAAGYGDKLLLSLDTTRARLGAYGGDISLTYILDSFLPRLEKAGVSSAAIRKMTVDNPAAALSRCR